MRGSVSGFVIFFVLCVYNHMHDALGWPQKSFRYYVNMIVKSEGTPHLNRPLTFCPKGKF